MAIKRKDFQKTSSTILEFLLKLPDEETSSRLRDTLLHGLHFLQQYYLILQKRDKEQKPLQWTIERGLSPLTPFREAPDKFEWPWIDVESSKVKQTIPKHSLSSFINLSPIILAVREGDIRYVRELLGEDPGLIDRVDSFGRDILTYAVQYQQIHVLKYLLLECKPKAKINTQANDGSTCLHRACYSDDKQQCNIEIVRILLENDADVTKQDVHSRSPLHWAVLAENTDCLKILLDYHTDVHVKDADGMTPAMWACHLDRYEHFKELSRFMKGQKEEFDNDGRTWIHHSVRKTEPLKCLKELLSIDSLQLRDKEGRSCLHIAAEQGSVHACRLIFQLSEETGNDAYIHDRDSYRQTPLHLATKNGHARALKELLDHGADPYLQDIHGISSFDYAQNRGLYFCRSVFEVYLREKRMDTRESQLSTNFNSNDRNGHRTLNNGNEVTPTPPTNGRANFNRRGARRPLKESMENPGSPSAMNDFESVTMNYADTNFRRQKNASHDDEEQQEESEMNPRAFRPPSSTASSNTVPPPIKPRKSSTTPTGSLNYPLKSVRGQNRQPYQNHDGVSSMHSEDDDEDDEPNSLEGHGGQSDFEDNQSPRHERPNSRLSIRHHDESLSLQSNVNLRRPHYKIPKHNNRHSMYSDYRFLDDQQRQSTSPLKSKNSNRSATVKEFPIPSTNRIGSGSGNQSATNRLKSGSKSSSNEFIPTLDLTVAGQKVFRSKQQTDAYLSNTLPSATAMRPPSGRLKPISSAKSSSSFTDDLPSTASKTLEDVTNSGKSMPSLPTKTHLYKKKLAPLTNNNEVLNKKYAYRSSIESPSYVIEDPVSDKSEETNSGPNAAEENSRGAGSGREFRSSTGSDKRSKYH